MGDEAEEVLEEEEEDRLKARLETPPPLLPLPLLVVALGRLRICISLLAHTILSLSPIVGSVVGIKNWLLFRVRTPSKY